MRIRPSVPDDVPAIAVLSSQLGYPALVDDVAGHHESIEHRPDHVVLVAEGADHQVVGWVHAFLSRRLFMPPFAELGGLVVLDSRRRSHVGSALLAKAEEWAADKGCSVFRIRTNTQRIEADAFYRESGYQLSKTQSVFEKTIGANRPA